MTSRTRTSAQGELLAPPPAAPKPAERPDLETAAQNLLRRAREIKVQNQDELTFAVDFLKAVKKTGGEIADFFRPMKKAADAAKKAILDVERRYLMPCMDAESEVKGKILEFQMKLDQANARAREAALENLTKAEAAIGPEAVAALKEQVAAAPLPEGPKAEGLSSRRIWKAKITDFKALARYAVEKGLEDQLLLPNQEDLDILAESEKEKFAELEIPGVVAEFRDVLAIRS